MKKHDVSSVCSHLIFTSALYLIFMLVLSERYRSVFRPSPMTIRCSVVHSMILHWFCLAIAPIFYLSVSGRRRQACFTTSVLPVFKSAKFVKYNQLAKVSISATLSTAWIWLTARLNCKQTEKKNIACKKKIFSQVSVSSVDVQRMSSSFFTKHTQARTANCILRMADMVKNAA